MSTLQLSIASRALEPLTTLSHSPPTVVPMVSNLSQVPVLVNLPAADTIREESENQSFADLSVEKIQQQKETVENDKLDVIYDYDNEDDDYEDKFEEEKAETDDGSRQRRAAEEPEVWGRLIPGACVKGCAFGFYAFSIVSSIVNCLGSSGRIGNLLVNYRCVSKQDKSVTQGLILMFISLFALIPGPIVFGRIIDQTCLVWTEQCSGRRGNCQLYDQRKFRYYINCTAFFLTGIGVFFDILVWKFGKKLSFLVYDEFTIN